MTNYIVENGFILVPVKGGDILLNTRLIADIRVVKVAPLNEENPTLEWAIQVTVTPGTTYILDIGKFEFVDAVNEKQNFINHFDMNTSPPVIFGVKSKVTIEVFDAEPNYLEDVVAYAYDGSPVVVSVYSTDVDANVVGAYEVILTASDDRGNDAYITIDVNVVDTEAPVIAGIPQLVIPVGGQVPDYMSAIVATDNYDGPVNVILLKDPEINTNVKGFYEAIIVARDSSGNETYESFTIEVDATPPVITSFYDSHLHIRNTVAIDYLSGVTAVDNYDGPVSPYIISNDVDMEVSGFYKVIIGARDSSGNESTLTIPVEVDATPPVITINYPNDKDRLVMKLNDTEPNYLGYITVEDNADVPVPPLFLSSAVPFIKSKNVDPSEKGLYTVVIGAEDQSGNKSYVDMLVEVDMTPPVFVEYTNSFIIPVGGTEPDYLDGVLVEDNIDLFTNIDLTIKDNNVNTSEKGLYTVVLSAVDTSGNESTVDITVEVDMTPPIVTPISDEYYILLDIDDTSTLGYSIDFASYFEAHDECDGNVNTYVIDDSEVDFEAQGIYEVVIGAKDSSDNEGTALLYVHVKPIGPEITGFKNHAIPLGHTQPNYLDGVTAKDKDGNDVSVYIVSNNVDIYHIGEYEVRIVAEDEEERLTSEIIKVYVYVEDY